MDEETVKAILDELKRGAKLELYMLKDGSLKIRKVTYSDVITRVIRTNN